MPSLPHEFRGVEVKGRPVAMDPGNRALASANDSDREGKRGRCLGRIDLHLADLPFLRYFRSNYQQKEYHETSLNNTVIAADRSIC